MREPLLDPTGGATTAARATPTARPVSLRGLRPALLDNGKPNARAVLTGIATELRRTHATAEPMVYQKGYSARRSRKA